MHLLIFLVADDSLQQQQCCYSRSGLTLGKGQAIENEFASSALAMKPQTDNFFRENYIIGRNASQRA